MSRWRERLEQLVGAYSHDVDGCDEAMALVHVYVDPLKAGADAAEYHPGLTPRFPSSGCRCATITCGYGAARYPMTQTR